jgi:putative FmdB family regulatory protein
MPIYEYRCGQGHTFEVMQRMSDEPVVSCETCAAPVERVFHPVAVHFKGSGFYNTDYGTRKRSREQKETGEGGGKSPAEIGSSGSESKKSETPAATSSTASSAE